MLARAQKGELQDAHARMLAEAEREVLTQAITLAEGNQAKAARWLGLSRFTLREKLKQLGLHPDSTEAGSERTAEWTECRRENGQCLGVSGRTVVFLPPGDSRRQAR